MRQPRRWLLVATIGSSGDDGSGGGQTGETSEYNGTKKRPAKRRLNRLPATSSRTLILQPMLETGAVNHRAMPAPRADSEASTDPPSGVTAS